jgi:hypothetical protein
MWAALGGLGPRGCPRSVAALGFTRRQRAVDPAPPQALDSGKKPVPRRSGNRSPGFGSSPRQASARAQVAQWVWVCGNDGRIDGTLNLGSAEFSWS